MAGKSDYLEQKILDLIFEGTAFSAPTVRVSLHTADPTEAGTGTEVSGGSYARVTTAATDWTRTTNSVTNNNAITFPTPSANWGTVTHFALWDAATTGNMLYFGALTTSRTINNGDSAPSFAASSLTITED